MLGFFVGIASLIGLAALRRRYHGRGHGCGHGYGHGYGHGCGHGDHGFGGRGGPWRRRPLWMIFEHLDTTPGQEKLIREELEQLWEQRDSVSRAWRSAGEELAETLRGETVDEATVDQILARHEEGLADVRKQIARSLARIHEALDQRQRERLARFLGSRGFRGSPFGGPYRGFV
jgi:Spy/CpxP family protein refolding chaperone